MEIEDREQELVAGRSEPRLLHRIAEVYFGITEGVNGTTPAERLANLVGSRADLVAVLREGLETVLDRPDLPDYRRVDRLFDSEEPSLALPLIAGMDSLERSGVLVVEKLGEERVRLAVAALYTVQYSISEATNERVVYRPEWFRTTLRDNPLLVADVFRRCVEDKLRAGKEPQLELCQLVADHGHAAVARLASLPLLEFFPNTDTVEARRQLGWLLKAASNNCERSQVRDVVKKRLATGDLVSGQQVYWLAAGYFLMPNSCRRGHQESRDRKRCRFAWSLGLFRGWPDLREPRATVRRRRFRVSDRFGGLGDRTSWSDERCLADCIESPWESSGPTHFLRFRKLLNGCRASRLWDRGFQLSTRCGIGISENVGNTNFCTVTFDKQPKHSPMKPRPTQRTLPRSWSI